MGAPQCSILSFHFCLCLGLCPLSMKFPLPFRSDWFENLRNAEPSALLLSPPTSGQRAPVEAEGEESCCLPGKERQHTLNPSSHPLSLIFSPKSVCHFQLPLKQTAFPTLTPHWGPLLMVITPNCFPLAHEVFSCLP